jgi:hypothetical protein
MKSFKSFLQEEPEQKKDSFLSWDSSHGEQREKKTKKPSFLSWDSSHGEQREKKIAIRESSSLANDYLQKFNDHKLAPEQKDNVYDVSYSVDHEKPHLDNSLSDEDHRRVYSYTCAKSSDEPDVDRDGTYSSKNLNYFLRNKAAGNDLNHPDKKRGFLKSISGYKNLRTEGDLEKAVHNLANLFVEKNTNKTSISTFGGIPESVAKKMIKEKGVHYLAGYTSTSLDISVAKSFASEYFLETKKGDIYIIHYVLDPHTGISVAKYSGFSEEEILLRYGTKIEFVKVTEEHLLSSYMKQKYPDLKIFVIHVRAHSVTEAKHLDEYGPYHHPEGSSNH